MYCTSGHWVQYLGVSSGPRGVSVILGLCLVDQFLSFGIETSIQLWSGCHLRILGGSVGWGLPGVGSGSAGSLGGGVLGGLLAVSASPVPVCGGVRCFRCIGCWVWLGWGNVYLLECLLLLVGIAGALAKWVQWRMVWIVTILVVGVWVDAVTKWGIGLPFCPSTILHLGFGMLI